MWRHDITAELSIFSTSLILTFLHTVINSFLVPVHSTGNLIYTCTGHIRFSHTITLTSLITSLRPHLGGIWRGRNPQAWSHLICSCSSDWFEMMSLPMSQPLLLVELRVPPDVFRLWLAYRWCRRPRWGLKVMFMWKVFRPLALSDPI